MAPSSLHAITRKYVSVTAHHSCFDHPHRFNHKISFISVRSTPPTSSLPATPHDSLCAVTCKPPLTSPIGRHCRPLKGPPPPIHPHRRGRGFVPTPSIPNGPNLNASHYFFPTLTSPKHTYRSTTVLALLTEANCKLFALK